MNNTTLSRRSFLKIAGVAAASAAVASLPGALGLLSGTSVVSAAGNTWYVSPTGSDSNAGTLAAPFKGITKAQSVAAAGDTVYLRGGTYNISASQIARTDTLYAYVHDISKSGINYLAYPGETPIFDFSTVKPAGLRVTAFFVSASNCYFKGFHITGVQVTITTHTGSECVRVEGNSNTFELLSTHDGMGSGIELTRHAADNLVLNCDSYNNWDSVSEGGAGGNSDGFGCHTTGAGNVFRACRAWNNSDDGFDCITCAGAATFDHCWSYSNGKQSSGDGNGFKIGGFGADPTTVPPSPVPVHTVMYCLSANNKSHGFYANHQPGQSAVWTNNTSYNHAAGDFDTLERLSDMSADKAGTLEVMHNNLAYLGTITKDYAETGSIVTNNSWTLPVTVSAADFQSVDATQMTQARAADGSLPNITFMHLVSGSDLTGLGCFPQTGSVTPTSAPTATRTRTPTQSVGASPTPGSGPTNTPTRTATPGTGPTATPSRTPTPGSAGSVCSPVTGSIAAPFTQDGVGTFCWQATNLGAYVNSWNVSSLTINGVDFTNVYVAAASLPAKINGFWYVSYTSAVSWGHFETK